MNKLQVTITNGRGWYEGLEGETFEVYDNHGRDFILVEDYDLGHDALWLHIDTEDCVVAEQPHTPGLGMFKSAAELEGIVIEDKRRKR